MSRHLLPIEAVVLIACGSYVLRYAYWCVSGTSEGERHVFFGITVNGGFMIAIGAWLLWKQVLQI